MRQIKDLDYCSQYWVGLMDGDGSIQVNHWRKKALQFRLVIKLKLDPLNIQLLKKVEQSIGGSVREDQKRGFLYWTENNRGKIEKICRIFEKFPPLTTRLTCQLLFFWQCIQMYKGANACPGKVESCVAWYLENRGRKYSSRLEKRENLSSQTLHQLPYFKGWLSGFIEAEGCFTLREASSKVSSFSISQKGDQYLLEEIRVFFSNTNKIRKIPPACGKDPQDEPLFVLEIYKKEILREVISHCTNFPLLGEKNRSFIALSNSINIKSKDGAIK